MKIVVHNNKHEDDSIVKGILRDDPKTIKAIYNDQFGKINAMVNNFHFINIDADDVFQEGLTRAIINIRKGVFKGDSTFSTYLYSICRNICLKEYNRNKHLQASELNDIKEDLQDDYFDEIQLMLKLKDSIDDKCKSIIDLRFGIGNSTHMDNKIVRFEEIAKKLNISSDNARQRFGRCFSKLKELLLSNAQFKQLID